LSNIGFSSSGKSVAMYIELRDQTVYDIKNNTINIQPVDDKLEQWMMPLVDAFESTIDVTRQYAEVHKRALRNKANFHHFTLYKDELPVSSLTLSLQANIARIDDVGTLSAYQNKGYATQLMKHAINMAISLGASYCFLEASESGISVYEKIGFVSLFKNNTYSFTRTN
jgi:GNAT superfamily N-acetyltransferase